MGRSGHYANVRNGWKSDIREFDIAFRLCPFVVRCTPCLQLPQWHQAVPVRWIDRLSRNMRGFPTKSCGSPSELVGAFNELRCRGLSPEQAKAAYERRFGARDRAIDAAMLEKYGPLREGEGDFLPIGKKCQAYRGAIRQSEAIRTELERRLGLTFSSTDAR